MSKDKKKKKKYDDDDGRTIADMNVEGMPWYNPHRDKKVAKEEKPTRKEMFAMMRGWFVAYLPRILAVLIGFGLTVGIMALWLQGWSI